MKGWIGTIHVYGELNNEPAESIAPLIVNALSMSNYTRMVLIVDPEKRVLLVKTRSKFYEKAEKAGDHLIGPVYRCGRDPKRFGLTAKRIAHDIRETTEAISG